MKHHVYTLIKFNFNDLLNFVFYKIKVVLSTSDEKISYPLDDRLVIKCGIKEFNQNGSIVYNDDSLEDFDAIIFCTGYRFSFPFLSVECSIQSDDNYIRYLYKHIININYPTMGFIGVPYLTFIFPMMDIQVTLI